MYVLSDCASCGNLCDSTAFLLKLAIGSFGWNEVVKTAWWFQNCMKKIYG